MLIQTSTNALRAQVQNLEADFAFWRKRTSDSGDIRQHRSQIERITTILRGSLEAALAGSPITDHTVIPDAVHLETLPKLRRDVGSVHLVWEFFRDKFAQREIELFEQYLGCGDDLAWACYKPCLDAAIEAGGLGLDEVKEPPLVFYSTHRSPFAQARTKMFHPQGLDSRDIRLFTDVVSNLPVPVIGVPWAVAGRLPELVLVGHETAHVVAEDLGLADEARKALEATTLVNDANGERRNAWLSWCDEIFADLFGVVATGRSFVAGLGAELAGGVDETRALSIDMTKPGDYPTPALRMALCEAALERLGVTPSTAWHDVYGGLSGDSRRFRHDVAPVVDALLLRNWQQLNAKRLQDVLPWSDNHETQVAAVAHAGLNEQQPSVAFDVRVWVAGALTAAHSQAARYASLGLDNALAQFIIERRADAVRSLHTENARSALASDQTEEQTHRAREERDRLAGHALYGLLTSLNE